jgi:hypothetical protein
VVVVAAVVFGLAHAYQGTVGVVCTSLFGLGMAGLDVATDSLLEADGEARRGAAPAVVLRVHRGHGSTAPAAQLALLRGMPR